MPCFWRIINFVGAELAYASLLPYQSKVLTGTGYKYSRYGLVVVSVGLAVTSCD